MISTKTNNPRLICKYVVCLHNIIFTHIRQFVCEHCTILRKVQNWYYCYICWESLAQQCVKTANSTFAMQTLHAVHDARTNVLVCANVSDKNYKVIDVGKLADVFSEWIFMFWKIKSNFTASFVFVVINTQHDRRDWIIGYIHTHTITCIGRSIDRS